MHLAFFHAPWCGVCHEKAPVVEQIATTAKLSVEHFDIEEPAGASEAERRGIKTVPTLALIMGERVPFRLVGAMITPENVAGLLQRYRT